MYGYIYITTNLINNKIYIGQHKSKNYDKKYLGSGLLLKRALKKYGSHNFKNEIIMWVKDRNEANEKEIYFIELYNSRNPEIGYNIVHGGNGGNIISSLPEDRYNSFIEKIKKNNSGSKNPNYKNGEKISGLKNPSKRTEVREKIRRSVSGKKNGMYGKIGKDNPNFGRKNSPEAIKNIKNSMKNLKYKKICVNCQKKFNGNSARSKYCCQTCKRQYRDNLKTKEL